MSAGQNISNIRLKRAVLAFFMVLLFVPMLQQHLHLVPERNLEQVDNKLDTPPLSLDTWFSGRFQKESETALDVNIGFRKTLVRLHNQINYSVFDISRAGGVVVGKSGYIYVNSYLRSYTGADYQGKTTLDIQVAKARTVQRELKKRNVDLVFVLAPGKGSFYPEYIPEGHLRNLDPDSTNYAYYSKALRKEGMHVLDLREYFLKMKDTATNKLFPIPGVHWTEYASVVAFDTIAGYISDLRKIKIRDFRITEFVENPSNIKWGDYDAANLMNIFSTVPHKELPFVKVAYSSDSGCVKPNLLTIADSYYSIIEATRIPDSICSKSTYWLYENRPSSEPDKDLDFQHEIEQRDVIMILATDATLGQFPYGFINEAYEVYAPKDTAYAQLKDKEFRHFVSGVIKSINGNKTWKKELNKSARENGVSEIDQYLDAALWLYGEEQKRLNKFVRQK